MTYPSECPSNADNRFGPSIVGCRSDFDFTLLFEQSILSLAPSVIFILASVPRLFKLIRCTVKTVRTPLRYAKPIAILCSASLKLALLVLWITQSQARTNVTIATASLSLAATLTLAVLSSLEHSRSVRPSILINAYLFFTTLLDLAQIRTLWLLPGERILACIFTASIALNVVLLGLESVEKKPFLKAPYRDYPPETLSGLFSRSTFWWLNGLFFKGYRRILDLDDLFETDDALSSRKLQQRAHFAWQASSKKKSRALLYSTFAAFKYPLSTMIFPRLCVSALKLCQPLLINRAVSLIAQPRTPENRNAGYGLIGATALIYIGIAIGNAKYKHRVYRSVTMIRGGLISLISEATVRLDGSSLTDSAPVTLMSTDIDRIVAGLEYCDFIWASPIEISVALYLLNREIGLSCLMPLGISLASAAAGYVVGNAVVSAQKNWINAVQKRVGVTASMLGSIKAIKMMGLSGRYSERIQDLKIYELQQSNKFRHITTIRNVVSNFSFIMAPALTFAVYTTISSRVSNHPFNPATAFTSLSIVTLISQSVQWWVIAVSMFQASLGCYERIQEYLCSKPRTDTRLDNSSGEEKKTMLEKPSPNVPSQGVHPIDDYMISISGGRCGYSDDQTPVLQDINLRIESSTLTMIMGPVGCGKSTLLKMLLGEMPCSTGEVRIAHHEIGYCAQEPWLPNWTIKQTITGFRDFDEDWYNTVVRACMLDEDIQQLSAGELTMVGSKGTTLSGGQKQRLALARAIYSRNRILLLDDVLRGLDAKTEKALFHQVLGPEGLCRKLGVTVVLVTHSVKYMAYAHRVMVFDAAGTMVEQAPPKELESHSILVEASPEGDLIEEKESSASTEANPERIATASSGSPVENSRAAGDLGIYVYYARSIGWILLFYLCAHATDTFFIKFPDVWLRWWSAAEVSNPGQRTAYYLGIYCLFGCLGLCAMVIAILTLFTRVMPRSSARLHKRLLQTVTSAPYPALASKDSGVILNRFSQDMSLIDMQLPTALLQTSDGVLVCIAQTILIAASSKFVATLIPVAAVVLYLIQRFYLRTSRQIRLLDLETKSPMYTHFLETISGLQTIRAFSWQSSWERISQDLLDRSLRPVYMLYCVQRWLGLALDGMVAVCAIVIITLATQLHQHESNVDGALGVALVNLLTFSSMLAYLVNAWTDMETSIGAVLRVRDFESSFQPEDASTEALQKPPADWPQKGAIEFCNVDATYDMTPSPGAGSTLVLKSMSLSITPSCHIGICGRTGSGKSSFLLALFQMIEITGGTITIDGIEIQSIPRSTLRERILCVPQSPEMFPGTIRDNLDPFNFLPDINIISALETVGLWSVIQARGGLLADASTPLSAGETQLFALACALLRRQRAGMKSGILVLDEFAASVDGETEARILGIVREKFAGWTVVSVVHRGESMRACDVLVRMDKGRIVSVDVVDGGGDVVGT